VTELKLAVRGTDDDLEQLHDLYAAILEDDELRPAKKSIVSASPEPGHMGSEDILQLVLTNTALLTALTSCATTWLQSRRSRLKLVVQGPAGEAEVVADGLNSVTPETVKQALEIARGTTREASR
jgi:hypothetical protein